LDQVLRSLAEIGYDAEWHCIPASAVGAPHRRDRIWIVAYPNSEWELQPQRIKQNKRGWISNSSEAMANTGGEGLQRHEWSGETGTQRQPSGYATQCGWWDIEPNVGRVADGVPHRAHRLRALGNAVVPQIPQMIGNAILSWYSNQTQGDLCVCMHKRV